MQGMQHVLIESLYWGSRPNGTARERTVFALQAKDIQGPARALDLEGLTTTHDGSI